MKTFVSRGGIKLEHALKEFKIDVTGLTVLDVGSSTGGFVDCLLQNGAKKVYALDTAYGEFAWKLRIDPRVVVMEKQNILYLESLPASRSASLGGPEPIDLVTIDVTFTSLKKILPVVKKFLKDNGQVIALVKPQYERQDIALKNKGVIPQEMLEPIVGDINFDGFKIIQRIDSPILGGSGNKEFLTLLTVNQE